MILEGEQCYSLQNFFLRLLGVLVLLFQRSFHLEVANRRQGARWVLVVVVVLLLFGGYRLHKCHGNWNKKDRSCQSLLRLYIFEDILVHKGHRHHYIDYNLGHTAPILWHLCTELDTEVELDEVVVELVLLWVVEGGHKQGSILHRCQCRRHS